jgi:hypothetical protein
VIITSSHYGTQNNFNSLDLIISFSVRSYQNKSSNVSLIHIEFARFLKCFKIDFQKFWESVGLSPLVYVAHENYGGADKSLARPD